MIKNSIQVVTALFLLSLPLFMISDQNLNYMTSTTGIIKYLIFCIVFLFLYLAHTYYLFPKFYEKSNVFYFTSIGLALVLILWLRPFDRFVFSYRNFRNESRDFERSLPPDSRQQPQFNPTDFRPPSGRRLGEGPRLDIASVFLFFLTFIIGFTKQTNIQLNLTTQRALLAEAEKVQAELSFLKAQVNPHFLFNTLNNIYTLAIIKEDNTGPSIMKLSNMMRYITDEAGHDFVDLQQEIDCITDFIDLQKLRLTKKTLLIFELEGDFKNKTIAPLLLMAFVENVFKYGVSNHNENTLIIKLFSKQNSLILFCQNTIYPEKVTAERSGIGMENTKRRLNYLYKDHHILYIDTKNQLFTVNLTIQLL